VGIDFELHETLDAADAESSARKAFAGGWKNFAIAGGDGTAHAVVNGVLSNERPIAESVTIGILPIGSGNDWARSFGVPKSIEEACRLLERGKAVPSDVAEVACMREDRLVKRFAVNAVGAGFDAYIVRLTQALGSGPLQYWSGVIRGARDFRSPWIKVVADGWEHSGATLTVLASIGRFLGGGMRIAPQAKFDDGRFEVTIIEEMGAAGIISLVPRLVMGSLAAKRQVRVERARSLRLEGQVDIQGDGELLGRPPATLRIIPRAIQVMADPAGLARQL
jgi:YegS/Rv2252/BmrU family lipid kinase